MGNMYDNCINAGGPDLFIYGDYFNADTRSIINILECCGIPYVLKLIDTLDTESTARKSFKKNENPADCLPMIVHGKFKIMSNMEHIMKYFKNTYPKINELLFENIEGDNFDRLTRWHQVTLKPKCEKLTE